MHSNKSVSTHAATKKQLTLPRYAYIDVLRGIAVLGVLLAHVSHFSNISYPSWLESIATINIGPRGVQLFYVVSAVTLCMSFSRRSNVEKHPILNFYIRRFFRIAPVFYAAVLYYLFVDNYWFGNPHHYSLMNIFTTITFTNGFSSEWINNIVFGGWSVAVETTFYLLFPFLFYRMKNFRYALIATISVSILLQIFRLYLLSLPSVASDPDVQTFTFQFFPSQLPVFLIGMTMFFAMHEELAERYKKQMRLLAIVIGVGIVVQTFFPINLIPGHYIYGYFFAILLYILSKRPYKIFVNPITIYIGKISYSLYLFHFAVYSWLIQMGLNMVLPANPYFNFALRFFILLGASSVIASLLFFTIEKYGIILGKKLINRHEKVSAAYIETNAKTW
jgi:peptidoglycan/LPS O-acetylase OafA/YrhL